MKYRIIKDRKGYRIQRRILFMWFYFWDNVPNHHEQVMQDVHMRFKTDGEAVKWIEDRKARKQDKARIIKEFSL